MNPEKICFVLFDPASCERLHPVVKCVEENDVLTARKRNEIYLIASLNQHFEGCS
jgi:hypothetical protein